MTKVRFDSADLGVEILYGQERNDVFELKIAEKTSAGMLRVQGRIGRVGVFRYIVNGQVLNELRPPDEVFDSETLKSFANVPLTLEHPERNGKKFLLTPENAKEFTVGSVGHPQRIGAHAISEIMITDAKAIEAAESGKTKLSGGYTSDVYLQGGVFTDSEGNDVKFNAVQRNIRGNHVAITDTPRAGHSSEFRMDSARFDGEAKPMAKKKIKLHGIEVELEESEAVALEAAHKAAVKTDSNDKPDPEMVALKAQVAELTGVNAGLQTKLTAQAKTDTDETAKAAQKAAVKSHAALALSASKHLDAKDVEAEDEAGLVDKLLEMEPIDIQKKVIGKLAPQVKLDSDAEETMVNGVYIGLISTTETKKPGTKKTGTHLVDIVKGAPKLDSDGGNGGNGGDQEVELQDVYLARVHADSEAWKPKTAA